MSDDELNLSSDEEFATSNNKKRKNDSLNKTLEPSLKKKKTAGRPKSKKKSKYYDDSDDDNYDDVDMSSEEEEEDKNAFEETSGFNMDDISSDESEDEYDADLYKDEEDRIRLAAMTDKERQAILFERNEKRNQIRERNMLKAEIRASRGLAPSSKTKSSKPPVRSRTAQPKRTRSTSINSDKKEALSALKAKRLESGAAEKRLRKSEDSEDSDYGVDSGFEDGKDLKNDKRSKDKSKSPSAHPTKISKLLDRHKVDSDDDDLDGEGAEMMYDKEGKKISTKGPITFEDILTITVKRDDLVKWLDAPYWEKAVKGIFVRTNVGSTKDGKPVYRLAEVIDFNPEGKSYILPGSQPMRSVTMALNLAIGANSKEFTLEHISNRLLEREEFDEWERLVRRQGVSLPSKKHVLRIAQQILDAKNYRKTHEDIEREIQKKQAELKEKGQTYLAPIYSPESRQLIVHKMDQLKKDLEEANTTNANSAVVSKIEMKLQQLERELEEFDVKFAQQEERFKARMTYSQKLAKINQRNRNVNTSVESSYVPESVEESALNPFARRPTQTAVVAKKSNGSSITPKKNNDEEAIIDSTQQMQSKASVAMSLDLDVDSTSTNQNASNMPKIMQNGITALPSASPAKVLSFADYLKRK